jgi:hypothetical protein
MAINFGDVLGGLGAAMGGTAQQYAQGVRQREQGMTEQKRAELEARQKAMYQDAGAAFQLLQAGDLDGIIGLAEDRLQLLQTFPDADPSDTMRVLQNAMAARDGDPMALRDLATELTSATSRGMAMGILQKPEPDRGVVVGDNLVSPTTGRVIYQGQQERPAAQSNLGQLARDLELGYISQEQFDALSQQETGQQPTPLEQVQLRKAEVELANAERTGVVKATEATERDAMITNELIRAYELAEGLRNRPGLSGAVGPIQGRMPVFDPAKADARADMKELGNLLTMANLGRMTGVLSESDIRLIASASSGLDEMASDERAIAKLNEIVERLAANPRVAEYLSRSSGGQSDVDEGTVIVNQQTGERRVMRNGSWEPI